MAEALRCERELSYTTAGGDVLRPSQRSEQPVGRHDLTDNWEVILRLLEQPDSWRIRAVEQLTVGTARSCTRHRSLQVAPLAELLRPYAHRQTSAYIALPIETLPKGPLLGYDLTVDGKPAYVAPRGSTAEVEAAYVIGLAAAEGVLADDPTVNFLTAICEFTPYPWDRVCSRIPFTQRIPFTERRSLHLYLEQGLSAIAGEDPDLRLHSHLAVLVERQVERLAARLGPRLVRRFPGLSGRWAWVIRPARTHQHIKRDVFLRLRADALTIGRCLRTALGEGRDPSSSADNPLLAAPLLAARGQVESLDNLADMLKRLQAFVDALAAKVDSPRDSDALVALAVFGKRWQTIAWCDVPLDRPFIVTSQREVPFKVKRPRSWARQEFSLADARSNHVTLSLDDENVEIATAQLRGVDGKRLEHTLINGLRQSREHFSLYASEPDRDRRAFIRFRLKIALSIKVAAVTIHAVTWLAVVLVAYLLLQHQLTAADLAVLVVPTTFGASLFLTRERTSLARRLQWISRLGTPLAVASLWALVAWAYLGQHLVT